jgi:type II secretory pathway component PulK
MYAAPARHPSRRPGYVLIAVMLVVVVLSLAAYRFAEAMSSEYQVSIRSTEAAQAKAFANAGLYYAIACLADPSTFNDSLGGNPYDNPTYFQNITVSDGGPRGGGRFSIVNVYDTGTGSGESRYTVRYGVEDESGKINLNALIRLDPGGTVLSSVLTQLPNMTEDLSDPIVDWLDSDDDPRPSGAESESYQSYQPKNGPLNSLDELLLVKGMTPDLLYGSDRNRNGKADAGEPTDSGYYRGFSDLLTVYGRELNVDSTGAPRTFINDTSSLSTLNQTLASAIGQQMADYVVAYRLYTTGTVNPSGSAGGSGGGGNNNKTVTGTPAQLSAAVQASISGSGGNAKRTIPNSILTLLNTQVTLPKPPNARPTDPDTVVPCPLNDPSTFKQLLPTLLDKTTAKSAYELNPRLNVNTAPPDVLTAAGASAGVTADDVNNALAIRANLTPGSPETVTGAWLVTQAGMQPAIFQQLERLITGSTQIYRITSIGYFVTGGPVARVEAIVDVNQGYPRIIYYRDLTDIGPGFTPPRQ